MFAVEDKENESKTQGNNKSLAATESENKDPQALKPRRSVLREFDPFLSISPCPSIKQSSLPVSTTVKEEELFEDAETSLKLNGKQNNIFNNEDSGSCDTVNTLNMSATNLFIPGLQALVDPLQLERKSPNPADISDVEYVEAFESLSSQPEQEQSKDTKSLSSEEDISIKIPHPGQSNDYSTTDEHNASSISLTANVLPQEIENTTAHIPSSSEESLNNTLGISSALEKLNIMDVSENGINLNNVSKEENAKEDPFKLNGTSNDTCNSIEHEEVACISLSNPLENENIVADFDNKSEIEQISLINAFENGNVVADSGNKSKNKRISLINPLEKGNVVADPDSKSENEQISLINPLEKGNVLADSDKSEHEQISLIKSLEKENAVADSDNKSGNEQISLSNPLENEQHLEEHNLESAGNTTQDEIFETNSKEQLPEKDILVNRKEQFPEKDILVNREITDIAYEMKEHDVEKTNSTLNKDTSFINEDKESISNTADGTFVNEKVHQTILAENDEDFTSMASSLSKTIDFEESAIVETSENSKSDISNESKESLNQTVNKSDSFSSEQLDVVYKEKSKLHLNIDLDNTLDLQNSESKNVINDSFTNQESNVSKTKNDTEAAEVENSELINSSSNHKNSFEQTSSETGETCKELDAYSEGLQTTNNEKFNVTTEENLLVPEKVVNVSASNNKDEGFQIELIEVNDEAVVQNTSELNSRIDSKYSEKNVDDKLESETVVNVNLTHTFSGNDAIQNSSENITSFTECTDNSEKSDNVTQDLVHTNVFIERSLNDTHSALNSLNTPQPIENSESIHSLNTSQNADFLNPEYEKDLNQSLNESSNVTHNIQCVDLETTNSVQEVAFTNAEPNAPEEALNATINVKIPAIKHTEKVLQDRSPIRNGTQFLNSTHNVQDSKLDKSLNATTIVESPRIKQTDAVMEQDSCSDSPNLNNRNCVTLDVTKNLGSDGIEKTTNLNDTTTFLPTTVENNVFVKLINANVESPVIKRNKDVQEDIMVDSLEGPTLEKKDSVDSLDQDLPTNINKTINSCAKVQNGTPKANLRAKSPLNRSSMNNTHIELHENKTEINNGRIQIKQNTDSNANVELTKNVVLENELQAAKRKSVEYRQFAEKYKFEVEKYQYVLGEYEKQVAKQDRELEIVKQENDTMAKHFSNLELAFSDVFQKYEKTKNIVQKYKENEDHLTKVVLSMEKAVKQSEDKYEQAKKWFDEQINETNKKVLETKEKYDQEMNSLKTKVKRYEIKCISLETALKQQTEECRQLAALCDEITGQ